MAAFMKHKTDNEADSIADKKTDMKQKTDKKTDKKQKTDKKTDNKSKKDNSTATTTTTTTITTTKTTLAEKIETDKGEEGGALSNKAKKRLEKQQQNDKFKQRKTALKEKKQGKRDAAGGDTEAVAAVQTPF
jgi:hypothetical protein